jgi:hypothetical protein
MHRFSALSKIFSNQQGQIMATFFGIFAVLLVFFLIPRNFARSTPGETPAPSGGQYCQSTVNDPNAPEVDAPTYTTSSVDLNSTRKYKMVKKAVLIDYSLVDNHVGHHFFEQYAEKYTDDKGQKFIIKIPNGEQGQSYKLPSTNHGENRMIFADYGLLYLFYADDQFNLLPTGSIIVTGNKKVLATADIYKAVDLPPLPDWVLDCIDAGTGGQTENIVFKASGVVWPDQQKSKTNEQLQLEWFLFDHKTVLLQAWWTPHCKPAVYLYPPQKMQINVKVSPAGFLTYTDPQYDTKIGWTVEAYPDGKLVNNSNGLPTEYPYLYFESKVRDSVIQKPSKGWVVKYEELHGLYQDILPKLGLNTQQTKDFSDYWSKALQKAPYYFVGVIDQANVDQIEKLTITPQPDSINRVRIYFERLDSPIKVESPILDIGNLKFDIGNSSLFRVVEWGGMVKNDPNHPFTCSQ